ncbi:ATP-binding cassette domain-containing protein [Endothiovibrio diazotrophicus]
MIHFSDAALHRGTKTLFEEVTLTLHAGQKVAVVGANGVGKSSLFSLLRGELSVDRGECTLPPNTVIAHVAQETPGVERPAIDYVMDGDSELREVERQLAATDDGTRQAELHGRLEAIGGYTARSRAARLMHGLGFVPGSEERPVASFSGGWRMRLNLAQALMCRSDLLLLDEPTNHLDLDAVLWLEEWLRGYPGTLLLISHDRDFIDRVAHHIAHLERRRLTLYAGNYSDFEVRRAELLAQQQSAFERQQREVAHIRSYVDRFRAKATKARQAQSRLKALARMELIAPAHVDSPFHFAFRSPEKSPHPLLQLEKADGGYGETVIFRGAELNLAPGDRVGLLGPNGAGKSTLIKLLAGELQPLAGRCAPSPDLKIGYFAQHQLEQLDPAASPLLHLQRLDPKASEQALRDFIGGFGFRGDDALAAVAPFSGGEKSRLALALIVYQRPNLLLLDEPTNHLDLEMRHALTVALQGYEGAMVVVSHDRALLRTVADRLVLVGDGAVAPFDGDLEEYRQWLEGRRRQEDAPPAGEEINAEHSAAARKERKRAEAERRKQLAPLRREFERLEKRMEKLAAEKAAMDERLADPALYEAANKETLKGLLLEQARLDGELAETEEAWLAAGEELEAAD